MATGVWGVVIIRSYRSEGYISIFILNPSALRSKIDGLEARLATTQYKNTITPITTWKT